MSDYDRELAAQQEEQQQHQAAALIQRKWREYYREHLAPQEQQVEAAASAETKELTEEEQREQLLEKCRQMLGDRETLLQTNMGYQRALSKIFAERRANQAQEAQEQQPLTADIEAKYWGQIQKIREERRAIESRRSQSERDIEAAKKRHESVIDEAMQYEHNFQEYVKEKAKEARFTRNSQPIPQKRIDEYELQEEAIYSQVHDIRIQYIKLRNRAKKLSHDINDRDKKKDGMHLIDFEQLKIENTNLNEKIEERNEDLLKLRKKATTTIHVLTHVKEKLEFVKLENQQLHKQVAQVEEQLSSLRDKLAQVKKERDLYANDNVKIKEKMPMIGAEDLLLDYEVRKKEIESCRIEVVELTNKHHELMQWIHSHHPLLESMKKTQTA
jgi:hypothetical protein